MASNKPRKFEPTAGTHAWHEGQHITDVSTLELASDQLPPPVELRDDVLLTNTSQAGARRWSAAGTFRSYGSHGSHHELDLFTPNGPPSPTEFPLSTTNIIPIDVCGLHLFDVPKNHLMRLLSLAVPSAVGGMLGVSMNVVNLMLVGHLSPALLAGAALGNAFMLITGFTVLLGLCSALDTLCSQAHGAHQSRLVGLIAQRAATAFTLVLIPIAIAWWYTEAFFVTVGQDPAIAALAGVYVRYALPSILPILYSEVIKRYLQAQSIIAPQIYVACIANGIHAAVAIFLLFYADYGIYGASIALIIGNFSNLVCWLIYLRIINRRVYRRTCPRPSMEIFHGWIPLFKLGLPGCVMLVSEWMAFEVCAIASGWIGEVELDTMVTFSNLCTLLTMVPSGLAISTSTLVGHALGGGHAVHARLYARSAAFVIIIFATLEFVVLAMGHAYLSVVFTSDPYVTASFSNLSWSVCLFVAFDCFQTVESGVLRGVGLQAFGAKTNGIAYYAFGLPLGFALAFLPQFTLGVPGLVIGLVTSVVAQTVIFLYRLWDIDWHAEMEATSKRLQEEEPDAEILAGANSFDGSRTPEGESDEEEERHLQERKMYGFAH
jgi:MATE family multidrug resistance protein